MLVSKFNLKSAEVVEEEEQQAFPESEDGQKEEEDYVHHEGKEGDVYDYKKLSMEEISERLSMLGKNAEGTGYTYLKATLTGLGVTDIRTINCFKYLQFVDLSGNNLILESIQPVTELPSLVLLQADKNSLSSAALNKARYLQVLILNNNKLTSIHDVYQPELSTFEAGFNMIDKIHFDFKMSTLRVLDLRNNIIRDLLDIECKNLDSLYLANNKITSLVGIDRLVNLRILHVRNNPIRYLSGFTDDLTKLQYLNVRNCKVGTLKQVKKLRCLPSLDTLVMKGTPYMGGPGKEDPEAADEEEDPEIRVEVLAALPRLKRLNKGVYSDEERTEAKDLMLQWLDEGEKEEEEEVDEEAEGEGEGELHVEEEEE